MNPLGDQRRPNRTPSISKYISSQAVLLPSQLLQQNMWIAAVFPNYLSPDVRVASSVQAANLFRQERKACLQ